MLSILDARLRIQGGDKSVGAGPSLTHVPFMRENMCTILCEMEANIRAACQRRRQAVELTRDQMKGGLENIGQRIRELREGLGLTRRQVAWLASVTEGAVESMGGESVEAHPDPGGGAGRPLPNAPPLAPGERTGGVDQGAGRKRPGEHRPTPTGGQREGGVHPAVSVFAS